MDMHRLIVTIAGIVLAMSMLIYAWKPSDLMATVILTVLAFLFGKASNGWNRNNGSNVAKEAKCNEMDTKARDW